MRRLAAAIRFLESGTFFPWMGRGVKPGVDGVGHQIASDW
jgi:hypothetical protein